MAPPFLDTAAGKSIVGVGDALVTLLCVLLLRRLWLCFGVLVGGRRQRDYHELNDGIHGAAFDTQTIANVKAKVSAYKCAHDPIDNQSCSASREPYSARALAARGLVASRAADWMTRDRPVTDDTLRTNLTGSPDQTSTIRSAVRQVEGRGGVGMATKRGFKSARKALFSFRDRVRI